MIHSMLNVLGWIADFWSSRIGRCFGALCRFTDAWSTPFVCSWFSAIDMSCNLFHVQFEYELSISVLRDRATCYKKFELEIEKVSIVSIFKLRTGYNASLFRQSFSLLLLCFLITFFLSIDISTVSRTNCPQYGDLERRSPGNSLLFTILSIFVYPWLTFTFCLITLLYLGRFDRIEALWRQD
jgi:hypothetical protein